MSNLLCKTVLSQALNHGLCLVTGVAILTMAVASAHGQEAKPPALPIENSAADSEGDMKPYTELIEHTDIQIDLVPIPGGQFKMGSPDDEADRNDDEGPQHEVRVEPFWMSKCEITWDAFEVWMFDLDIQLRDSEKVEPNERDKAADEYQLSQPTEPYTDMTFGMGKINYPAICITQFGAKIYCQWLSAKTGRYYRLPTEAEWEYAARAGSDAAYSFDDDPAELEDYGWFFDNSDEAYHPVGEKKPNAWGLHDMHGNVWEWVLDQYTTDFYGQSAGQVADNPLCNPKSIHPCVVRGGSWDDDPDLLRSSARLPSTEDWSMQDPQLPKSIWYHTDALHVGFRIVRPLTEPSDEEKAKKWDFALPEIDRKAGR